MENAAPGNGNDGAVGGFRLIKGKLDLRVDCSVGYTQVIPLSKQLPHSGFCSPHLILRPLHEKHPPRDFLCERRVKLGARVRVFCCFAPSS